MKVSNAFSEIIKNTLSEISTSDLELKQALENPDKGIDDCVTYILNTDSCNQNNNV